MDIGLADGIAIGVILLWTYFGFSKGLAGQMPSLITLLFTATVAYYAYTPCRNLLSSHIRGSEAFIRLAAGVLVVVGPFALMMLIRSISSRMLQIPVIGWVDRIGGAVAGFISATLFVLAVFFLVNFLPPSYRPKEMGSESFIGRQALSVETNIAGSIEQRIENAEGTLQKARENHAGRREKWEE